MLPNGISLYYKFIPNSFALSNKIQDFSTDDLWDNPTKNVPLKAVIRVVKK